MSVDAERAAALIDLRRFDEAQRHLGALLAREPGNAEALGLLAHAQQAAGRPEAALATVTALLALRPGSSEALRRAALVHRDLGQHGLAHDAAVAAVRAAPSSADAHVALAEVGISGITVSPAALPAAQEAVRLAPAAPGAHITLGNVQRALKKHGLAKRSYEEALRLDPQSAAARNNLALVAMEKGRPGASAREFIGLLAANPQNVTASRNLRVAVATAMRFVRLVLIGPLIALLLVDSGVFGADAGTLLTGRITVGVLAVILSVGYCALVLRRGGPGLKRYVSQLLRSDRAFLGAVALLAAAVALFVVTPVFDVTADTGGTLVFTVLLVCGNLVARRWAKG